MQIVVFNITGSLIKRDADSNAIRIAYLLGEQVDVAGSIISDFDYLESIAKAPLKDKITFVEGYLTEQEPSTKSFFIDFKKANEIFIAAKSKTKDHLAVFKKSEHIFMHTFDIIFKFVKDELIKCGFIGLKELFDGTTIRLFSIGLKNKEREDHIITASAILSLNFKAGSKNSIFLLNHHFFQLPFAERYNYVNINHTSAGDKDVIWIEPLFTIPTLQSLTVSKLKFIRASLNEAREAFCNKANKWINSCFANTSFEERKKMLQSDVFPIALEFGNYLNGEPTINHLAMVADVKKNIEICMGEIPYQLLLDYHSYYKIINGDTLAQIKILQEKEEQFNNRWPVLFYRLGADKQSNYSLLNTFEDTISPVKKSINID